MDVARSTDRPGAEQGGGTRRRRSRGVRRRGRWTRDQWRTTLQVVAADVAIAGSIAAIYHLW
jgi:hypothetical protein